VVPRPVRPQAAAPDPDEGGAPAPPFFAKSNPVLAISMIRRAHRHFQRVEAPSAQL